MTFGLTRNLFLSKVKKIIKEPIMRLILFAFFICSVFFYLTSFAAPIPKVIHTCNFDKNIDLTARLENWKNVLPDFDIKVWNEKNFDLSQNIFLKKAYKANQYDLLSAYCGYKALYEEGGVYLSPFWQANKNIAPDLNNGGFISFMHDKMLSPFVIGMQKGHPLMGELIGYYQKDKRALGLVPPAYVLTDFVFKSYPTFLKNGQLQTFSNDMTLFPATRHILNLGSQDNIGNYRFDYTPKHYKTSEMSFGILKDLFLKEHAIKILYNDDIYHVFPSSGHTYTVFERRQHMPWGYIDEHTAALNWLGPTFLFTNQNGLYVFQGNYVLAGEKHYGPAKEIKVQGNTDFEGAKRK